MTPFAEKVLERKAKARRRKLTVVFRLVIGGVMGIAAMRCIWVGADMVADRSEEKAKLAAETCHVPYGTDVSNLACKDGEVVDKTTGEKFIAPPFRKPALSAAT